MEEDLRTNIQCISANCMVVEVTSFLVQSQYYTTIDLCLWLYLFIHSGVKTQLRFHLVVNISRCLNVIDIDFLTDLKNTISSSFGCDFSASFRKQTFISKIGIYDDEKNLIAVANLATPVKKLEDRDYTFKLKLDI